ncbi:MAG: DMT family transporter [Eubacteriales bacterium]
MGYIYLLLVTLGFSFVGVFVKTASLAVNAYWISFLRFAVSLVPLLIIMLYRERKIRLRLFLPAIVIGALGKSLNYLAENYALEQGVSYGNILVWPVQCIVALFFSVYLFREKMTGQKLFGALLCLLGIGAIAWNGASLSNFLGENLLFTALYVLAGLGASAFMVVQRKLLYRMSALEANTSMFVVATVVTALPLPFVGETTGVFPFSSLLAIAGLALVSAFGFLMVAAAMKTVPFFMVSIIQSTSVLFTLLWGSLFYREPITAYIIIGTLLFVAGIVFVNLRLTPRKKEERLS